MTDVAASMRWKLLESARETNIPFQRVLTLYKQEGLLHRIVSTKYGGSVFLKGGLLFFQVRGMASRPTKDIDLLVTNDGPKEPLLAELLYTATDSKIDDGLTFDPGSIIVAPTTGQTGLGGVRGHIIGYLGNAKTRLQIDMSFGDVVTGNPVRRPYRTLLASRTFSIQMYPDETAAAEKIEATISLGTINSRYKDLFDLFTLLVDTDLDEDRVIEATANTFRRRQSFLPDSPESLSIQRWESKAFNDNWNRFLARIGIDRPNVSALCEELLPRLLRIYVAVKARARRDNGLP